MSELKAAKHRRVRYWMAARLSGPPYGGMRDRLRSLLLARRPWWDWGHRLMVLTGTSVGGNWSEPHPPTWWYRSLPSKPMWRTGYGRSRFQVVTDYKEFQAIYEPLNEDQRHEWSAFATNQDGHLVLGKQYWGGSFYGLTRGESQLLGRYLRKARRADWYGLRSWLYSQALHAVVHQKRPFRCNAQAGGASGGYSHWYCELPRKHDGLHRYRNYVWGEIDGEPIGTHFMPESVGQP